MVQGALSTAWISFLRQVGGYLEHGMHFSGDFNRKTYLSWDIDSQSAVEDSFIYRKTIKARS